jgi:hypothetical protein
MASFAMTRPGDELPSLTRNRGSGDLVAEFSGRAASSSEVGFGDLRASGAAVVGFSAIFESCRDDRFCRQGVLFTH